MKQGMSRLPEPAETKNIIFYARHFAEFAEARKYCEAYSLHSAISEITVQMHQMSIALYGRSVDEPADAETNYGDLVTTTEGGHDVLLQTSEIAYRKGTLFGLVAESGTHSVVDIDANTSDIVAVLSDLKRANDAALAGAERNAWAYWSTMVCDRWDLGLFSERLCTDLMRQASEVMAQEIASRDLDRDLAG